MDPVQPPHVKLNFFIVGAPKCGTTSLHHYLRQHPEVFMPGRKEPHFFSTDIERPDRITEREYYALFDNVSGRPRVGEASAEYFYSIVACQRIKELFPEAKIIITLRNPVDKIHSAHAYRLWLGREKIEDFEEALARDRSDEQRNTVRYRKYIESGMYAKYVRMYRDTFGTEQVHIIIFEEMIREPEATFKDLCRFLDIRTDVRVSFDRRNPAKAGKIRMLSLPFLPSSPTRHFARSLPKALRNVIGVIARGVRNWNMRFVERPRMHPELRQRLEEEFADDVAELSALLGRDLSNLWFSVHGRNRVPSLG